MSVFRTSNKSSDGFSETASLLLLWSLLLQLFPYRNKNRRIIEAGLRCSRSLIACQYLGFGQQSLCLYWHCYSQCHAFVFITHMLCLSEVIWANTKLNKETRSEISRVFTLYQVTATYWTPGLDLAVHWRVIFPPGEALVSNKSLLIVLHTPRHTPEWHKKWVLLFFWIFLSVEKT